MATFVASPDTILSTLRAAGITDVVLGDRGLAPTEDQAFRRAVAEYSDSFRLAFSNDDFEVWEMDGGEPMDGR
jgi:hypothetical protein